MIFNKTILGLPPSMVDIYSELFSLGLTSRNVNLREDQKQYTNFYGHALYAYAL